MSNVVILCLACRLQKHSVLVQHSELTGEEVRTCNLALIYRMIQEKVNILGMIVSIIVKSPYKHVSDYE